MGGNLEERLECVAYLDKRQVDIGINGLLRFNLKQERSHRVFPKKEASIDILQIVSHKIKPIFDEGSA